ncbi:MAG TPA: phosphoenolpyruvate synthase [Chitinophagales bacterium]|nr:phosphoenolpyruvate synthase [Chitinophagales bacterium]
MKQYIKTFSEIELKDIGQVGGKNASLGEMFHHLVPKGILVPDGFATTADAYWDFLDENNIREAMSQELKKLDVKTFSNLRDVGENVRSIIMHASLHQPLRDAILKGYRWLVEQYGSQISLAVRSSATAEDLPTASFAGQQETFLNVRGEEQLLKACHRCFASLFTNRAIKYRHDHGFDHMKVALSIGVQVMVRADKACSGVIFTIDPDSGFENVIVITGAWGLGENVVQGTVNTDEFIVYKPHLGNVKQPIISHKVGSKAKTMIFSEIPADELQTPEQAILNTETPEHLRHQFILRDEEITKLAQWAVIIESHYGRPMDIEFAKDGISGNLYIVQARPETIHSARRKHDFLKVFHIITEQRKKICEGIGLGSRIVSGKARVLHSPDEATKLKDGEILVTERTNPDWDPIMKKAAAIVTDQGGRTSHAAIVAREIGAIAVIGTGHATELISDGQEITVSCAEGERGFVYDGKLEWSETEVEIKRDISTHTKPMLILAHPDQAFTHSFLPSEGVGLLRIEFIISNAIGIHPMALYHFDRLEDAEAKEQIKRLTVQFPDKKQFFIQTLAESVAQIAAAFFPKDVIVRMSDFKTNEYASLIGGKPFEPSEENPMIGFRGASRYYHTLYKDGFELECKAMKMVREEMGFTNVKLMIPFCRTLDEAQKVTELMKWHGLERGKHDLELYMMIEIPSNALLAEKFADYFDGFSIGSNDLTQLTLGADRDSELLSEIFSPFDPAVMQLIRMSIKKAKAAGVKIGLCGQAPSDFPEYGGFLVDCGIDSISFNPDALLKGIENIQKAEKKFQKQIIH